MIIENSTGPSLLNQTNLAKEGGESHWVLTLSCRQLNSSDYYRDESNPEYEP